MFLYQNAFRAVTHEVILRKINLASNDQGILSFVKKYFGAFKLPLASHNISHFTNSFEVPQG